MRLPALLLLAALAGCGGYRTVKIPHLLPAADSDAGPAMGALYLSIEAPAPAGAAAGGELASALLGRQEPEPDFQALAGRVSQALAKSGAKVCAWRVSRGTEAATAFADRLKPSGILHLKTGAPTAARRKEERNVAQYDRKNQKQSVKRSVWVYSARLSAETRLLSWPGGGLLDSWSSAFETSEDRADAAKDPQDWYPDAEGRLYSSLAEKVSERYAGRPVERRRPLFSVKGDKASEKAVELALAGLWEEAEAVWRSGAGWRGALGLAVAAEARRDYAEARKRYAAARELAAGDKAARGVRWEEIDGDLERALRAPVQRGVCDRSWFEVRTALLPFSDGTTSVDGPPLARQLLFERLKAAGYSLVPLEEADEALRRRGYSDGGQLAAARPADLAAWLGAGRLLYGDITDYGEIMAGVYNRRMVAGSFRTWEAGGEEFSFSESVVRVKTPKSLLGGLAGQLAKGLLERIRNKPLAYEAGLFSRQAAENLPAAVK